LEPFELCQGPVEGALKVPTKELVRRKKSLIGIRQRGGELRFFQAKDELL
jgi:hypothetical protein